MFSYPGMHIAHRAVPMSFNSIWPHFVISTPVVRELATLSTLGASSTDRGFEPDAIGSMGKDFTTKLSWHLNFKSVPCKSATDEGLTPMIESNQINFFFFFFFLHMTLPTFQRYRFGHWEAFCLSCSTQVIPLYVTTLRDSYTWNYRELAILLTPSESLVEVRLEPLTIWSMRKNLTIEQSIKSNEMEKKKSTHSNYLRMLSLNSKMQRCLQVCILCIFISFALQRKENHFKKRQQGEGVGVRAYYEKDPEVQALSFVLLLDSCL